MTIRRPATWLWIAALLTGCSAGGASPSPSAAAPFPQDGAQALSLMARSGFVPTIRPARYKSWVNPDAKNRKALLYVADTSTATVKVYDYKSKALLGEATGFQNLNGVCSDKAGDVYVVDENLSKIFEFKYGSTAPARVLTDGTGYSTGCSVNPKNGDLAVTNFFDYSSAGGVLIYKAATGTPRQYTYGGAHYYWPAGYDAQGNLFVEGANSSLFSPSNPAFLKSILELPHGRESFKSIALNVATIYYPGAVEWDGEYLSIGDQMFGNNLVSGIYRVKVSGSTATVIGSTGMSGTCDVSDNDILVWAFISKNPNGIPSNAAKQVAASNLDCNFYLGVWTYPKSGINNPVKTFPARTAPDYAYGQTLVTKGK